MNTTMKIIDTSRQAWWKTLMRVAGPVLDAAEQRKLKETMPIQQRGNRNREECSYFEAAGRLVCGMAPWLEAEIEDAEERAHRDKAARQARALILGQVDPASPDYAQLETTCRLRSQILVDAAFMAQGILRAPHALWEAFSKEEQDLIVRAFIMCRKICPWYNNWILFAAEVEAALKMMTGEYDPMRVDYAVRQLEQWYVGDGLYADGPHFAMDYYNSYVIQPMLLDVVRAFPELFGEEHAKKVEARAIRYAALQERMIAPDGSFIVVGRSIAYRCGSFHLLAQMALEGKLPEGVTPAGVRCGLGYVIARTLTAASFRPDGFLTIGVCGDQPSLGEDYISTGSLYLCSGAFLPLGLPASDPFWRDPDEPWTQKKIWDGADFPADHKME